jgi:hypothetical protein
MLAVGARGDSFEGAGPLFQQPGDAIANPVPTATNNSAAQSA